MKKEILLKAESKLLTDYSVCYSDNCFTIDSPLFLTLCSKKWFGNFHENSSMCLIPDEWTSSLDVMRVYRTLAVLGNWLDVEICFKMIDSLTTLAKIERDLLAGKI